MKFTKIALLLAILSISVISQIGSLMAQFAEPDSAVNDGNVTIQANEIQADINEPYSEVLLVNNYSGVQYQAKILSELNRSSEVAVMVEVRDTSGIDITKDDTIEQQIIKDQLKMEFLRNKTNAVLATLPETEFRLKRKFLLGGFSGNATKEGFDKLVNDSNIAKIYLNGISYTGLDGIKPIGEKDVKLDYPVNVSKNAPISKGLAQKEQKSLLSKFIQFLKSLFNFKIK